MLSFAIEPVKRDQAAFMQRAAFKKVIGSSGRTRGAQAPERRVEVVAEQEGKRCAHCNSSTHSLRIAFLPLVGTSLVAYSATPRIMVWKHAERFLTCL
jgi:hypothetical protein